MQTNRCLGFGGPLPPQLLRTGDRGPYELVEALTAAEVRKSDLKRQLGNVEDEIERLKQELAEHARRLGTDVLCGSTKEVVVSSKTQLHFPSSAASPAGYRVMVTALQASPFWAGVSSLNHARLQACGRREDIPASFRELIRRFGRERQVTTVKLRNRR